MDRSVALPMTVTGEENWLPTTQEVSAKLYFHEKPA